MSRAAPEAIEQRWQSWLLDRNRRGMRIILWVGIVMYPAFGLLDYLSAPADALPILWTTRAVFALVSALLLAVVETPFFDRHPNAISGGYMLLAASGISSMTVFLGGLSSPYYAGLSLVIFGNGLIFVWKPKVACTEAALIVASFVLPNLAFGSTGAGSGNTAFSNVAFLGCTAVVAAIGQMVLYRSQREQLVNQVRLEETKASLEKAHEQLKALDSFKSQLFANITHEFKTPLAMMLAPLELTLQGELGDLTPTQRSTFEAMFRSGLKLLKLIGDLLDLSKLEEAKLRLKIAEHDLVEYLRGLVAQVQPLAERKGIELRFESQVERSMVFCDLERIERVFLNLLSNATKFTPPAGHILVRLADDGTRTTVLVRDDGPGFPADKAEQIFERFFQVEMAGTRRYGGTGIGLALAKEICELHGGRVWAQSSGGAEFTVELLKDRDHFRPEVLDRRGVARDLPKGARASDRGLMDFTVQMAGRDQYRFLDIVEATERRVHERDADEDARGHVALVIDDTPDILRLVHMALRSDFKVLSTDDPRKGFEMAMAQQPSLIVTDLMMPEVDGLELTRRLRADERTRHIPILMLTARGDLDDKVKGLETGVNAYLAKPFSPRELLSTARQLVQAQDTTADILLTQRMDSLEVFAAGLAHEINNPLNYLKNSLARVRLDARILVERPEGADLARVAGRMSELFDIAESGIRRIAATVELMSNYSRAGYSRMMRAHDAFAAARDVLALVLPATGRNVRVETQFDGDGRIECVPEEFNQVLSNLIQNAIEACPGEGGAVRIGGSVEDDRVVLSVKDNGPGIPADVLPRIFLPFFTTKGPGRGMGLGLTIAWRVVQSLGGSLEAKPGQGAEFVVRVPRAPAQRRVA